ncbi:uncharacterized protein [Engystomops pustulosus]|uniref:uncharacterized protein n=1 Tax=Engystomops pustulosus TaxID=76066 RepID=UPI003AFA0E4F
MHCFPANRDRTRNWLLQAPHLFTNVEQWVEKIMLGKKTDAYRMCSLHFTHDCYYYEADRRRLRPNAVPTVFEVDDQMPSSSEQGTSNEPPHPSAKKINIMKKSQTLTSALQISVPAILSSEGDTLTLEVPCVIYPEVFKENPALFYGSNVPSATEQLKKPTETCDRATMTKPVYIYYRAMSKPPQKSIGIQCDLINTGAPCTTLLQSTSAIISSTLHSKESAGKGGDISVSTADGVATKNTLKRKNIKGTAVLQPEMDFVTSTPVKGLMPSTTHFEEAFLSPVNPSDSHPKKKKKGSTIQEEVSSLSSRRNISADFEEVMEESFPSAHEKDSTFTIDQITEDTEEESSYTEIDDNIDNLSHFELLTATESNPALEEKYIVFKSSLKYLLRLIPCPYRKTCNEKLLHFRRRQLGSLIIVDVKCTRGHITCIWRSQPRIKSIPAGNLLLSASVLMSGSNFLRIKNFFKIFNLLAISGTTYYEHQRKYLFPTIDHYWRLQQNDIISSFSNKAICVAGDGQADSPGFSAKYTVYTMMEVKTKKIIAFTVEQLVPPATSVSLEKIAFEKTLQSLLQKGVFVGIIATDRHVGIRKLLRENYKEIIHEFDVWHMAKSIGKKMLAASKVRSCSTLSAWIAPVKNHLWWSARNSEGNPDLLVEKWVSVIHHAINKHEWSEAQLYHKCSHPPLPNETKWLKEDSIAHQKLKSVVENKAILRDICHLSNFCHTGDLEVFHASVLKYRPKRIHFYFDSMVARTQLAIIDHNFNVGRVQATRKDNTGEVPLEDLKKHRYEYSKARKAWVVKILYEPKRYDFTEEINNELLLFVAGDRQFEWASHSSELPKNIAPIPCPPKEEMLQKFVSRF